MGLLTKLINAQENVFARALMQLSEGTPRHEVVQFVKEETYSLINKAETAIQADELERGADDFLAEVATGVYDNNEIEG